MGRPRAFDADDAMQAILDVFWMRGYAATSIQDLVNATGLKKGSLYAAFGDKRAMYQAALALHGRKMVTAAVATLGGPGAAKGRLEEFLRLPAKEARGGDGRGCFLCNAALDRATADADVADSVRISFTRLVVALDDTLAAMPKWTDATARRAKAVELLALHDGFRVMARTGVPLGALDEAATQALATV